MRSYKSKHYNPETKIWNGGISSLLFNPHIGIGRVLLEILERSPNKIGQISDNNGVQLTNNEIRLQAIRVAQVLTQYGYKKGDTVSILAKNGHELVPTLFGLFLIGAPFNVMDPNLTSDEIQHMISIVTPKLFFTDESFITKVKSAVLKSKLKLRIVTFEKRCEKFDFIGDYFRKTEDELYYEPLDLGDMTDFPAFIACSSGTTGLPKGVLLSHADTLLKMQKWLTTEDTIVFVISSLYWMTGMVFTMVGTLRNATRIMTNQPSSPELICEIVQKYKVTSFFTAPYNLAKIVNVCKTKEFNLTSVELCVSGGSHVRMELIESLQKYVPNANIVNGYGMSEFAGVIAATDKESPRGSVGRLCPGTIAKIIDDEGNSLGIREKGEVCIKGFYRFLGYLKNEQATKETIDRDDWIHSGDLGYFDEEGNLFLIDRKKELLKYCGYQIAPSEIEKLIETIHGLTAVVVGIPDPESGTELATAIVVRSSDCKVTESDINELILQNLSDSKRLRGGVYFVDNFPINTSGKVQRRKVKEDAINFYNNRVIIS